MKASWQIGASRMECRWSEVGQRVPYTAPWIQKAAESVSNPASLPAACPFPKLSPFGGAAWYAPRRVR